MKFKKIMATVGSGLMAASTVALAAAAAYPAPFVQNGASDVAFVWGSDAALSDSSAATMISADLAAELAAQTTTGTTTVTGGDSVKFEKSSTKFQLGKGIRDIDSTSVTDDDMPMLLADGKFIDDDNDEFDFTQEIDMANLTLTMFEDNDYKADTPTIGMRIANGANVLNYTLDFTDEPLWSDLETTDLTLMGKSYYVLDVGASNDSLTLLDSAADAILAEGESTTLDVKGASYDVSINFVAETEVILNVNGEVTNSLAEGETQKLSDGSYVGVKDILYTSKDTGVSKVEFSIGNGKLVLANGSDVELNDDSVSDLSVVITNSGTGATTKLSQLTIVWNADDDLFVTEDSEITMPGFETVKVSFGGMIFPEEEEIVVEADSNGVLLKNFPLKDTTSDIYLLAWNDASNYYQYIGKDSDEQLVTANGTSASLTFDGDDDAYFVASWSDGDDSESYLMRVNDWKNTSGKQYSSIQYQKDGEWTDAKEDAESGDTVDLGNVELGVGATDKDAKTTVINANNSNTYFDRVYSAEGLRIMLPVDFTANTTALNIINLSSQPGSYTLNITEEDKDDNVAAGNEITLNLSSGGSSVEASVETVSGASSAREEIEDSDVIRSFVYSALATEILEDENDDQESVTIVYHGSESYGEVYLTDVSAMVTSDSTETGFMTVTDAELSSVSGKNLVVIGGNCVNSLADELLGTDGDSCLDAFNEATGVSEGGFLIESFSRNGKTALLVAGYSAQDTTNAATYLVNNGVDTMVGKKVTGTGVTAADVVVA